MPSASPRLRDAAFASESLFNNTGRNIMHRRTRLAVTATALLFLALALAAVDAVGQQPAKINKTQLVGSWTLVSNTGSSPASRTFGPNDGVAIFEANGRFS